MKNFLLYAIFAVSLCWVIKVPAQSVGIGNASFIPDAKSIFEVRATSLGMLIPRMTWANRPAGLTAPQDALMIYSTDGDGINGKGYYYWDGTSLSWKKLFGGAVGDYIRNQTGLQSAANFNIDGNGYIGGNVGIGTTGPGVKLDVIGTAKANAFVQNANGLRLTSPSGGSFVSSTSSITGAIKITLPQFRSSTMMRMTVKIYQYSTDQSYTIELGGYNYVSGSWYNTFAYATSKSGANLNVRFGYDGSSRNCIWIGETSSSWAYPQVFVTEFQGGYSNYSADQWDDGWSVTIEPAFATVEAMANTAFVTSGTGTANFMTKWTGAGNLGNSIAYDNGTNVGIGTTGPTEKLEINGNLRFTPANPYLSAASYFIAPGGAYFNSGTVYCEAPIQARGGVNDDGGTLVLTGSSDVVNSASSYFQVASKYVVDGTDSWLRLNQQNSYPNGIYTPYFFRSDGGIASGGIGGLGGGTIHASGTIRGAGFQDYSTANQVIDDGGGWHRSYGATGFYNGTYGGGIWMNDATWVRVYNGKNFYTQSNQSDYNAIFGEKNYNVSGAGYYDPATAVKGFYNNPGYGDSYRFGTYGKFYHTYSTTFYGWRCGGVLGSYSDAGGDRGWGSLAYNNSGGTFYGGYFTSYTSGGGYMDAENGRNTVGSGSYGGLIGSWSRGEIMGQVTTGELFAGYNLGNSYTSGHQAEIVTVGEKRVAAYPMASTEVMVYKSGKGQLVNGKAVINYDETFVQLLAEGEIPNITATPVGDCRGLHIETMGHAGFSIAENQGGNSGVEFTWMAIGKRVDAENARLPEDLADKDFDENMKAVMFNENNTDRQALPVRWDGKRIQFGPALSGKKDFPIGPADMQRPDPAEEALAKQKKYSETKTDSDPASKGPLVPRVPIELKPEVPVPGDIPAVTPSGSTGEEE